MTGKMATSRRARALALYGRALQAAGLWRPAAAAYEAALRRDNRPAEWRYRLGLSREHQGQFTEATAEYEEALARGDADAQAAIERVCRQALEVGRSMTAIGESGPFKISFLPAPSKFKNLASARIRCTYLANAINEDYAPRVGAVVGVSDLPSIIVISQTCSAKTLVACAFAKGRGARIVYDCCDPYADYEGAAHGVQAAQRFKDIASLADAITVPTEAMRARVTDQGVSVPIVLLPDTIDYQEQTQSDLVPPTKSVVWFGNPGRGNLESGLWALKALKQRWNFAVTLITDPSKIEALPDFSVEPWAYDGFVARLRRHGLALISQDSGASYKSENRYVVAIMNGIPAISTGSESISDLLHGSGFSGMQVDDDRQLNRAVELLSDPSFRSDYVARMQGIIRKRFGPFAVANCFIESVLVQALGIRPDRVSRERS
jgi:tetratricopeptide (TPR) repeat protein